MWHIYIRKYVMHEWPNFCPSFLIFKMGNTAPTLPTSWFCINHENRLNYAYLNVLETTKHFINTGNCHHAKGTSINWSAVIIPWSNVQFTWKQTQINQGKMFYAMIFLRIFMILAVGDYHRFWDSSRWSQHGTLVYMIMKYLWQNKWQVFFPQCYCYLLSSDSDQVSKSTPPKF